MHHLVTKLTRASASRLVLTPCGDQTHMSSMHRSAVARIITGVRFMSSDTDFKPSEELAKERYDMRANEDIEKKRARLLYQSRKRGMLENGVILASFANKYLHKFDANQLDQYDKLINLPTNDWDIYYWATRTKPTPPEYESAVLEMLRQHLNSKVSNNSAGDSVLGKTMLDDIVMPAVKKHYDLELDYSNISLTDYSKELYDDRKKVFANNSHINLMTNWRKQLIKRRLKRTISSPTSLIQLSESNQKGDIVYTQRLEQKELSRVLPQNLLDTKYERKIKHHNFLQHLLGSNLTLDPLEYDDESEAWANMVWHRNYGNDDDKISPSQNLSCSKCRSTIQCCNSGLSGYVPKEIFVSHNSENSSSSEPVMCQRCKFSSIYDAEVSHEMNPIDYENFLNELATDKGAIVVILVDLTDLPGSIWPRISELVKGYDKRLIVVGNKLDLLPYDGTKFIERITYALRKSLSRLNPGQRNLYLDHVSVLSARTGYGVEDLVTKILSYAEEEPRNVYLVGNNNTGKSTLFSSLIQSDLSAIRTGDLISRVSRYKFNSMCTHMLKFPINNADGWEVELKVRKQERVSRNFAVREHALSALSSRRQKSMPQTAVLINRLEYTPQTSNSIAMTNGISENEEINNNVPLFSDDHPLKQVKEGEPLSATREQYPINGFFHHTPSATHPDQINDLLTKSEKLEVYPNETIIPRKYSLRPLHTIFIAGLGRLDLLTSQSNVIFTIFTSRYLPIHVVQTRKADKFYNQFLGSPYLGVPFGNKTRLALWPGLASSSEDFRVCFASGSADIVLSSIGWALVSLSPDQECIIRAHTPEGRGIYMRNPPLLARASSWTSGKKIINTPVFKNSNYVIHTNKIESQIQ